MKVVKYVVAVFIIMAALGGIFTGDLLTGFIFLILGVILLPPISNNLKSKIGLWENKIVRYVSYFALIVLAGAFINKSDLSNEITEETNPSTISAKKVENKVRIIDINKAYYDANGNKIEADENDITYRVIEVLDHKKTEASQKKFNSESLHLLVEVSNYEKESLKSIALKVSTQSLLLTTAI